MLKRLLIHHGESNTISLEGVSVTVKTQGAGHMENEERVKDIEYLLKKLARFHREPTRAFYKELAEELFVRYAEFEDEMAGYTTLSVIAGKCFQEVGAKQHV